MIKGVNRQVIEINESDCEYFERVMFFVKPECANVSEGRLRERANAIAGTAGKPPATKIHRGKVQTVLKLIASACAGAAVAVIITLFIH